MSSIRPDAGFPLLPDAVPRVGTDDLDEMRWLVRDGHSRPGWVVQHSAGALGYWQQRLFGQNVHIGSGHTQQPITVRGHVTGLVLQLVIPPGNSYRLGRRAITTTSADAALLPADLDFTRTSPAGTMLALRFDAQRVQAELAARQTGADGAPVLAYTLLSLTSQERQAFLASVAQLVCTLMTPALAQATPHTDARLEGLLASALLRHAPVARRGALSAARLAALEDWIDAHLAEPLTLGRLCAQAGVGARSLQLAFESRRGMSPLRFVSERRFTAAHRRLMRAAPSQTVTSVALDCGFDHMGRFSLGYKRMFGESPSQTLAARRRAAPSGEASGSFLG